MFVALCPKATLTPHLACLQMLTLARPHRTEQPDGQTEEGTDELARVLLQHPSLRVRVGLLLPMLRAGWVGGLVHGQRACCGPAAAANHACGGEALSSSEQPAQELRSGQGLLPHALRAGRSVTLCSQCPHHLLRSHPAL